MPDETGPWWVEDQETGHRFVSYSLADHLKVLPDESPYGPNGLRAAEPAETPKPVSGKTAKKEPSA